MFTKRLILLMLSMVVWFLVGLPLVSWISWEKAEGKIAALESAAQQDEKIPADALCVSTRKIEMEAVATEKILTAISCIALGFLMSTGGSIWQRRVDAKADTSTTQQQG